MGIFSKLFGDDKEKTTQSTTQETASSGTKTETSTATKGVKEAQSSSTTGSTRTLDEETTGIVQDLIRQLGGQFTAGSSGSAEQQTQSLGDLSSFINEVRSRAGSAEETINASVQASQDKARQDFRKNEGAAIAQAQQGVGAKLGNSFSALIQQEGEVQLATELANIGAQGAIAARELANSEFRDVGNLLLAQPELISRLNSSGISDIAGLANILKGANVESTEQTDLTRSLSEALQQVLSGTFSETGSSTGTLGQTTEKNEGLLKKITDIF